MGSLIAKCGEFQISRHGIYLVDVVYLIGSREKEDGLVFWLVMPLRML